MHKTSIIVFYLCMPTTGGNYAAEDLTWTKDIYPGNGNSCSIDIMQIKRTNGNSSLMFDVLRTMFATRRTDLHSLAALQRNLSI